MTTNKVPPTTPLDRATRAQTAISYADDLRSENDMGTPDSGMSHAAVLALLAQAEASLAHAEATARVAQAIQELTASLRDNGITTW